uniref:G-protein coupled receptors family 1 profile domain-containing protein n=1 Tax=Megaselia scalaris TaxID=36166 RepID=T1GTK0_MEGSC
MYRNRYLGLMIAATWLGAFSALIPTWRGKWGRFGLDKEIGSCSILPDKNETSPKELLFTMAFLVPCFCIIICYARIFYIVRKTALKSHKDTSLTSSSFRLAQGKNSKSMPQNLNHSNHCLINKHSKSSREENSENSSSVSTSSGYPVNHEKHDLNLQTNKSNRPYLTKVREDEM